MIAHENPPEIFHTTGVHAANAPPADPEMKEQIISTRRYFTCMRQHLIPCGVSARTYVVLTGARNVKLWWLPFLTRVDTQEKKPCDDDLPA